MDASVWRSTKYIFTLIQQGPNSFFVEYTEEGVHGSKPVRLDVEDSFFTDEAMTQIHAALEQIEIAIDKKHQALEDELGVQGLLAPRAKVHALVKQAEEARSELAETTKAQQALLDDAKAKLNLVANMHAVLDNALVEKNAAVTTLDGHISKAADLLAGHQTELAHIEALAVLRKQQLSALEADIQQSVAVAQAAKAMVHASVAPPPPATPPDPKEPA